IAVPPFEAKYLRRGHAVHFRCEHAEAEGMRVDIMTRMRGVAPFPDLWERRTTLALPDGTRCDVMSISDLVQAKKTQRDKDWPMIRRLVEAHYFQHREQATAAQVRFWLRELRTPELLVGDGGRSFQLRGRARKRSLPRRWPARSRPSGERTRATGDRSRRSSSGSGTRRRGRSEPRASIVACRRWRFSGSSSSSRSASRTPARRKRSPPSCAA
ncbi:MAG TPA: hypothetical protein VFM88_12370, partial [Vicinamibacteria bacterium]|nr:hypothetical protein [Vicinamibacteria bacterium]